MVLCNGISGFFFATARCYEMLDLLLLLGLSGECGAESIVLEGTSPGLHFLGTDYQGLASAGRTRDSKQGLLKCSSNRTMEHRTPLAIPAYQKPDEETLASAMANKCVLAQQRLHLPSPKKLPKTPNSPKAKQPASPWLLSGGLSGGRQANLHTLRAVVPIGNQYVTDASRRFCHNWAFKQATIQLDDLR